MSNQPTFKSIWNILKIIIAVVLVGYVFSRTDINELLSLKAQIVPFYLIATFLLYAILTIFKAYIYQILIQQNIQYLRILNVVVLQNAISNFLANGAGFASYLTMLKVEENVKVGKASVVFLIMKIGDLFSVWFVMLVYGLLYWKQISTFHQVFIWVETAIGLGFIVFFLMLFSRSFFISIFSRLAETLGLMRFSFVQKTFQTLDTFVAMDFKFVLQTLFIAFSLSFIYYLITLIWGVVSMYAFGFQAEVWTIIFVNGILQIFSILPIGVLGGVGITEATSLYLYPLLGVNVAGLSAILLGNRVLYYLTNLFVLIYLPAYTFFIEPKMKPKNNV